MKEQERLEQELINKTYINKHDVLNVIKDYFEPIHKGLALRPEHEQNIIGNLITVAEIELKKDIKNLKSITVNAIP